MIPSNTVHLFVKAADPAVRRALLTLAFDAGYKWSGQERLRYGVHTPHAGMSRATWLIFNRIYTSSFGEGTLKSCIHYSTNGLAPTGNYSDGFRHVEEGSLDLNDFVSWLHDTI